MRREVRARPRLLPRPSQSLLQTRPGSREEPLAFSAASASFHIGTEDVEIAFSWDVYAEENKSCCFAKK